MSAFKGKADITPSGLSRRLLTQSGHDATAYSITSSARARTDGGMVRPSALAVLRFTASSNFVGCKTGKSLGLAPLRIFPQ